MKHVIVLVIAFLGILILATTRAMAREVRLRLRIDTLKLVSLNTNLLFLFCLFQIQACSHRWSGNLTVQEYSCNSNDSCRNQLREIGPSSMYIGKHSCNGERDDNRQQYYYHWYWSFSYIHILYSTFFSLNIGDFACHSPGDYVRVEDNACNQIAACNQLSQSRGSVTKISQGSCNNLW